MKASGCLGALVFGLLVGQHTLAASEIQWRLGSNQDLVARAQTYRDSMADFAKDGGVQLLWKQTRYQIDADKIRKRVDLIYFYPTSESIQNSGSDSFYWDVRGERLSVLEALVIGPDGATVQFNSAQVEVLDTNEADIFTDNVEVVLQLPGLRARSFSVLSYQADILQPDDYLFVHWLQTGSAIKELSIEASWSDVPPPQWHVDQSQVDCVETENALRCAGQNITAAKTDPDVLYRDVLPTLTIGSSQSWEDAVQVMNDKMDAALADPQQLVELQERLANAEDSFALAHEIASREIRYVSYSKGKHSHEPHHVSATWQNKYGDCKDKSALLVAMLRSLGYEAYPVLVASERLDATRLNVPSFRYFDHMVVCVDLASSQRCLDPTDSNTGFAVTPRYIQGRVSLALRPNSRPGNLPAQDFRWDFTVENELTFQADGSQQESLERVYDTTYAAWLRGQLLSENPPERNEWLIEDYEGTVSGGSQLSFEVKQLSDVNKPITIASQATFESVADTDDDLSYTDYAFWLRAFVKNFEIENDHYAVHFPGLKIKSSYRFNLNDIWRPVDVGPELDYQSLFGWYARKYKVEGDVITVVSEVVMPRRTVELNEFGDFNRFIDIIRADSKISFWAKQSLP